ncbi:hypothetical protein VTN00DRAFT_189 [Thermoascus crustaceus]|uniref:uncharacterized protein n=1 Tax=Thermoascus crustaceus TaxID=5088 RepID=UPI0037443812
MRSVAGARRSRSCFKTDLLYCFHIFIPSLSVSTWLHMQDMTRRTISFSYNQNAAFMSSHVSACINARSQFPSLSIYMRHPS